MTRSLSWLFLFIFSTAAWGQQQVFQGRVDLGRDLASFEASPAVPGTLYLLTGAAAAIRVTSTEPFEAEVDFVEGEWQDETSLIAHRVTLKFQGDSWSKVVVTKKPRSGGDDQVYPYRKFQVAAVPAAGGFRVLSVTLLF